MARLVGISEAASLALHTLVVLAARSDQRFTNQEIAQLLQASEHHLAKVMQRLARAGLVASTRGPLGGFQLARPAGRIKLLAAYEAVDGPLEEGGCLLSRWICDGRDCALGDVLQSLHRQLRDYLAETSLAELTKSSALRRTLVEISSDQEPGASSRPIDGSLGRE